MNNNLKEAQELKENVCDRCGKPKHQHYEVWDENSKPIYYECEIVRDDCNKNFRFKEKKGRKKKAKENLKKLEKEKIGCGNPYKDGKNLLICKSYTAGVHTFPVDFLCPNCKDNKKAKEIYEEILGNYSQGEIRSQTSNSPDGSPKQPQGENEK